MTEHIVIMAGGVGSRLFPLSTPEHPKQFIDLLGCGKTLIQLTYERFAAVNPGAVFWVVTSAAYTHFVREQLPQIPADHILAEPEARNTAPCIAYACRKITMRWPDANVVVTPADAYVPDVQAFAATMRKALNYTAKHNAIVCIGIAPTSPHTGYGYIHASAQSGRVVKVKAFKEKPSEEVAKAYLAKGGYWWNAGIFAFRAAFMESQLKEFAPRISSVFDALEPCLWTEEEDEALSEMFPTCEKISIDYAVMEKSSAVHAVAASSWQWSDLGSFEAIAEITGHDPRKNI